MAKYTGGYAGSWAKGFASTFAQAPSMIFNALQWKEKKKEKEKIDKEAEEFKLNAAKYSSMIDNAFKDGTITQQEYTDITSFGIILGSEYTKEWENLYKNYKDMTSKEIDSQLETIKFAFDKWTDLGMGDTKALMGILDEIGSSTKYDKVKYQVDYLRKAINSREQPVPEIKEPKISDYGTGLTYLKNIINVSPENWETAKKGLETKFGVDYTGITQEALKEAATEDKKYYSSAEEAMTTSPDIKGLSKQPVQISLNQWKIDYTKETVTKPIPEGEIVLIGLPEFQSPELFLP